MGIASGPIGEDKVGWWSEFDHLLVNKKAGGIANECGKQSAIVAGPALYE